MKAVSLIFLSLLATLMMTGCTNKPSQCFPGGKCNHYEIKDKCGSTLKYECEDICRQCNAYEPQCYSCYACLENSPQQCLKKHESSGGSCKK